MGKGKGNKGGKKAKKAKEGRTDHDGDDMYPPEASDEGMDGVEELPVSDKSQENQLTAEDVSKATPTEQVIS